MTVNKRKIPLAV
ncbi:hypothetical protein CP8484711_0067, partial [Chlamydia psittaci 84-8471/1]